VASVVPDVSDVATPIAAIAPKLSRVRSQLPPILPCFTVISLSNILSNLTLVGADLTTVSADLAVIVSHFATVSFRRVVLLAKLNERVMSARSLRLCHAGETGKHSSGDDGRSCGSNQHSSSIVDRVIQLSHETRRSTDWTQSCRSR
jgi:hypothetical protein